MNRHERLAKMTKDLMFKQPFWGLFLIGFNKRWDESISTACVSKSGINYALSFNPWFFDGLNDDNAKGILLHECIHIGFFHLERHKEFDNVEIRGIAADLVVNQYVPEEWLPAKDITKEQFHEKWDPIIKDLIGKLKKEEITKEEYRKEINKIPPRGVYLEDFAEMKLKPKEGLRYYYDKLLEESKKKNGNQHLKNLLGSGIMGEDGLLGHPLWKEFENLSEAEQKLIKSQIEYQLKEVADQVVKSRGTVPGEIAAYLDALAKEEPPKFDWKGYLRRFMGGSIKVYTRKSRRKLSKRFDGNPGLKIKHKKHILVGIDTSGSVSNEELVEFFHEIDHMSRTGADITVAQCDSSISHVGLYKRSDKIKVHGRGGTSFDPVVDYFNENIHKFTSLVYLTDGYAPAPSEKPKGKCLWVISTKGGGYDHLKESGWAIKLN